MVEEWKNQGRRGRVGRRFGDIIVARTVIHGGKTPCLRSLIVHIAARVLNILLIQKEMI